MVWLRCVVLCFLAGGVTSFNLETRIPVIKLGKKGSYFGFSVAEHQTISEEDGSLISWLLVGAPLDQNRQPNTTKSGALWKCRLSMDHDCDQVVTDGKRSIDSDDLRPPRHDEIKDGQWLGVSVRSQGPGGKVVVCAHRYTRKWGESHFGQGLCYTLKNTLSYDNAWEPCKGRPVAREHEEFGYCQAGTSSSLLADGTLLVGSPGPFTWRGTVFNMDTNENFLERDALVYYGPLDNASPVPKYSYLGISVVGAKFFSEKMAYAAGAPRANGTGQVVLFTKRISDNSGPRNLLNVSGILNGEQFGSSYGYEVAAADVNGDGLPDLLVGAPFYFTRVSGGAVYLYINNQHSLHGKYNVKLTGRPESQFGISIANAGDLNKDGCEDVAIGSPYDGSGVVFIYLGHRKDGLYKEPKQVITAESLPVKFNTFGYSLSGGIDLDANGYPDLLVGAYNSSGVSLLRARPIIDIKTFIQPASIKNIDPTKHGCEKDPGANYTCFHFEACCKIESFFKGSKTNIHYLNYTIEAETFPGGKKFSRVFFESNAIINKTNVLNGTIQVTKEEVECREHIVYLKENTRDIQSPIRFQLNYSLVQSQPLYSPLGALPNIDDYPVLNATATNAFTATFLNDCGQDGVCISDLFVRAQLDLPMAGDKEKYTLTLGEEDEIRLIVTADNYGESAYETHLYIYHTEQLHYIAANVTDKHVICSIHNTTVVACALGNPFKKQVPAPRPITLRFDPKALEDHELSVDFKVWINSTSQEMTPGWRPIDVQALVVKNAELYIKGIPTPEQVFYGGEVKGESVMHYLDEVGSRVVHTYQVFNDGPWRVTSLPVVIWWPQQVANDKPQGKWLLYPEEKPTVDTAGGGQCFIDDKYINPLELRKREGVEEPPLENLIKLDSMLEGKYSSREEKDSSNSTVKQQGRASGNRVRRKRDSEMIVKPEAYTDKDGQRRLAVDLNCENGTAKCLKIKCVVYKLARGQVATINIKARVWNSTLVEDYPRVSHVNIASSAHIMLPDHFNIHQDRVDDDHAIVPTVAYPDLKTTEPTHVPLWVIIAAVVAGLIVLILLILALWKFGFFKRSRPDPTLSGNLEKNTHEGSPFLVRDRNSLR